MSEAIGRGTRRLVESDSFLGKAAKTTGVWGAVKLAGMAGSMYSSNPEITEIADILAPIAGVTYSELRAGRGGDKTALRFLAAGLLGYDLADQLMGYSGNIGAVDSVRDGLKFGAGYVKQAVSALDTPEKATGALGGIGSLIHSMVRGYRDGPQRR